MLDRRHFGCKRFTLPRALHIDLPEKMDAVNRALCYFYKHPPPGSGVQPLSDAKITELVWKKDGSRPSAEGVRKAHLNHKRPASERVETRGRKKGWRKTTKTEDKAILAAFHKVRPPGHGVESREVADSLDPRLKAKICRRTIRNRLAEKGYVPTEKIEKGDPGLATRKARVAWCEQKHGWSANQWARRLQAAADLKDYTFYPRTMKARFKRWRATWTIGLRWVWVGACGMAKGRRDEEGGRGGGRTRRRRRRRREGLAKGVCLNVRQRVREIAYEKYLKPRGQ